ncbi:CCA tRNA nucleotidyltransferase [SAR202 cluster bacterium AD-802-E10_MRT_200m]|nr:CCA tRNA nucleotidyltransferase [SAR202 cluster bacterium AD-802-E10_MRT_200m]
MNPPISFPKNFEKTINYFTQPIGNFFTEHGVKAYLVGGFIRDSLADVPCHDIDIVVEDDPEPIARKFAKEFNASYFLLDPDHKIYRVLVHGGAELTPQSSKIPSVWNVDLAPIQGSIEEDLYMRDFTINAIALDLTKKTDNILETKLIDPMGGIEDLLSQKTLRSVSPAAIHTDPVRILRGVRIGTRLGLSITAQTQIEMKLGSERLFSSAPERIRNEILNILSESNSTESLLTLDTLGVLQEIFPRLSEGKGVSQPFEHYWDVFQHSIEAVKMTESILNKNFREQELIGKSIPWEPWLDDYFSEEVVDGYTRSVVLKLTALLHDIAKPATKTLDHTGRARFIGHTNLGASMCSDILKQLRLSGKGINMVTTMVEQHLRPGQLSQRGQQPTLKAIYRYFRDLDDVAIDTLFLNLADYLAARGPKLDLDDWEVYCGLIAFTFNTRNDYSQEKQCPRFVDGHDLITIFKMNPGPRFRPLLEMIQEAQSTGLVNSREEALSLIETTLTEEHMGVTRIYD